MNLTDRINQDIKTAMLKKEKDKLDALRGIKSALLLAKTEKGAGDQVTADKEPLILQKLIKQRKEAAEMYMTAGRDDLYKKEMFEMSVIEQYLPNQLSDEELDREVKRIILEQGATSMKEMGKVMNAINTEFAGRIDNKKAADKIKQILSSQ